MKSIITKVLVLMLVACMLLPALVACGNGGNSTTTPTTTGGTIDPNQGYVDDGKTYSYRMGPSSLPTSWNLHTYQSNDATYILDYAGDSLYTFEYNDDFTGYVIVPSMASGDPVDVTAEYVGRYGVAEGDTGKVYRIPLKTNLKFDNGEVLNARSFVESMKLLLNPAAANFRADNVYASGDLKIYGAEEYVKQGSYALAAFVSEAYGDDEYVNPSAFTKTAAGTLQVNGKDIVIDLNKGGNWGSNGFKAYNNAGYLGENNADYAALEAAADDNGWVKLTDATLKSVQNLIAILHGCANVEEYAAACEDKGTAGNYAYVEFEEMAFLGSDYPEIGYDGNVGFFAEDDNTLVVALKNAMEDNFYLRYELCTNFFLVYAPLYESLISDESDVYANTYATSVNTFVGYGPYKLTTYVGGSTIVLERNLNWHGYAAGEYKQGTYQTDRIVYQQVTEDATRLEMFLKGELDSYGLTADDMSDYLNSKYTYFTDSESTWYLAMNPDLDTLKANQATATPATAGNDVIKTVLTLKEFRQALSYSLNRTEFNQTLSPTSGVAKALLSSMIVADPDSGLTYRSMDEAKDAILKFWGLDDKWGEGKEYEDRDDAIASITGFDPAGAKTLFDTAYDKAVAAGLITEEQIASGKWEVQIQIGRPVAAKFYDNGYDFLAACWTNAVKGTKFEGHLSFVQSAILGSTSFGTYLRNGTVDVLFGVGYGGSMFNPYNMMDCFTGSLQYDPFTDKTAITMDVELDGKVLRASLYDWVSKCLQGNAITAYVVDAEGNTGKETVTISAGSSDPASRRVTILAAAECAIMEIANIFPVQTDATASLRGMRVNYKTEDYVVGMGRGGIEWYTYTMDDASFAEFVKSQSGGVLNYK